MIGASLIVAAGGVQAAPPVYTPAPGTPVRQQIMDAIREGTGSTSTFIVHRLRVTRGRTADIAYAEVDSANASSNSPFGGWLLLSRIGGRWRVLWGVGGGGAMDCDQLEHVHRNSLAAAGAAAAYLFDRDFYNEGAAAARGARQGNGCVGDLILPSDR